MNTNIKQRYNEAATGCATALSGKASVFQAKDLPPSGTRIRRIVESLILGFIMCGTAVAETVTVRVGPPSAGHSFVPDMVSIQPGDTVRWVWESQGHTVTSGDPNTGASNGMFGSGLRNTGYQFSFTFPNPGSYYYYCGPHQQMGMFGFVNVGSPTPTPTPAAAAGQPLNVSTRLRVQTGEGAMIGGFIITGSAAKRVIIRAIGPSLSQAGVAGVLADPTIELNGSGGAIARNDDWKTTQQAAIEASGVPPSDDRESAIMATLAPGSYTAIVAGKGNNTGVGLVEVYDLDQPADSKLANISTRGAVGVDTDVMVGGFILGKGTDPARILVRAIGPTLTDAGISAVLADPTLQLRDANGVTVRENDDWKQTQQTEIEATGIPPRNDRESAIVATLTPAPYTAILAGKNGGVGVGLVEVYQLQ